MSKLEDIVYHMYEKGGDSKYVRAEWASKPYHPDQAKEDIKGLILELIGDPEQRETEDMSLSSWTPDDYKAFGKNELKIELRQKAQAL